MFYVEGASISSDKNSDLFWTDAQSGSPYSQRSNSSHHQQVVGRSSSRPTSTSSVRSSTSSTSSDMQSSTPLWGSHSYGKIAILTSLLSHIHSLLKFNFTCVVYYGSDNPYYPLLSMVFSLTHSFCQLHGI